LETYPYVIEALQKEGFRAVQVAAGDSISVAVNAEGEIRAWGSFRVGSLSIEEWEWKLMGREMRVNLDSTRIQRITLSNSYLLLYLVLRGSRSFKSHVGMIMSSHSPLLVRYGYGVTDHPDN
jgi:hypothetical protein